MADESGKQKRMSKKLLSYKGKRDILVGGLLISFPLMLLIAFEINIGAPLFALALVISSFMIIRTWSRELNWVILKRRFPDD